MATPRELLLAMYRAALSAAEPSDAVARALAAEALHARSIRVLAFGKAAGPMAEAASRVLGARVLAGVVVVPSDAPPPTLPPAFRVLASSHPIPDESSVVAGAALLEAASAASPGELVLVLLSGGASSLAEVPAAPLDLDDVQRTTALLLRSGASIVEINAVRKHLSALKAGGLLRAAGGPVLTLALSDVAGAPLDVIGSGPTVGDTSTFADVARILDARGVRDALPPRVRARVDEGASGRLPETPRAEELPATRLLSIGDASSALSAAARVAEEAGYEVTLDATFMSGDAEEEAARLVARVEELRERGRACAFLRAGECSVLVRGGGRGGRNQHLALAVALGLHGDPQVTFAALATDGIDGPTDAAGAIVDGWTVETLAAAGVDARASLARCDSYPALDAAGALVRVGLTGTNVNDLAMLLVTPPG